MSGAWIEHWILYLPMRFILRLKLPLRMRSDSKRTGPSTTTTLWSRLPSQFPLDRGALEHPHDRWLVALADEEVVVDSDVARTGGGGRGQDEGEDEGDRQ